MNNCKGFGENKEEGAIRRISNIRISVSISIIEKMPRCVSSFDSREHMAPWTHKDLQHERGGDVERLMHVETLGVALRS